MGDAVLDDVVTGGFAVVDGGVVDVDFGVVDDEVGGFKVVAEFVGELVTGGVVVEEDVATGGLVVVVVELVVVVDVEFDVETVLVGDTVVVLVMGVNIDP